MSRRNIQKELSQGEFPPISGTVRVLAKAGSLILLAYGNTVPSDATAGYAIGALFIHTDGGAGTALYCNEGSATSSDFDAVTVA